jgi:hypothetical protein
MVNQANRYVSENKINLPNNRAPMVSKDLTPSNDWRKWFSNVQVSLNSYSNITFSQSIPSTGLFAKGNIIFNLNPIAGGFAGWICVQSGTAGVDAVFKTFGLISS